MSFTVDAHPQRRFRGKVFQVRNAPQIIQNVVTYNSVVRINNKELLLKPGMTANVQFLVAEKEDVLTIPNIALRFRLPEEKNEAEQLLTKEQGRVGGRITQRRTSRGGGSGVGGGEGRRVRQVKIYVLKDGKAEAVEIGETELQVAELIRPKLVADGMFLVGIDIVGDRILEVNVFSPGNLNSCSRLAGVDFSVPIIEAMERKVAIAEQYAHSFDNRHLAVL